MRRPACPPHSRAGFWLRKTSARADIRRDFTPRVGLDPDGDGACGSKAVDKPAAQAGGNVMMICPNLKCRKVLQVAAKYRGQQVRCHHCSTLFVVPAEKPAPRQSGDPA